MKLTINNELELKTVNNTIYVNDLDRFTNRPLLQTFFKKKLQF